MLPIKQMLEKNNHRLNPNEDSFRIFHGRGGCYPDLHWCVIDSLSPVIFITLFKLPPDNFLQEIINTLNFCVEEKGYKGVIVQHRYKDPNYYSRVIPNTEKCEMLIGELPEKVFALRQGLKISVDFSNQNIGFFFDIEPARKWLESQFESHIEQSIDSRFDGKNVLNLFSFTCTFSVVARAAGAGRIVNIDMSKGALKAGQKNHQINQLDTKNIHFLPHNILKSWNMLKKYAPYDIIIIDPPSFQRGSFVAAQDYQKVMSRLNLLLANDGHILACLNTPQVSQNQFKQMIDEYLTMSGSIEYETFLEGNPDFPNVAGNSTLKMLVYAKNNSL